MFKWLKVFIANAKTTSKLIKENENLKLQVKDSVLNILNSNLTLDHIKHGNYFAKADKTAPFGWAFRVIIELHGECSLYCIYQKDNKLAHFTNMFTYGYDKERLLCHLLGKNYFYLNGSPDEIKKVLSIIASSY